MPATSAFDPALPLLAEHAEIERQLGDPAVHADPAALKRLNKRYAALGPTVAAYRAWERAMEDVEAARELAGEDWLVFACGRYEGIDERVYEEYAERLPVSVLSLGDYVLNGGEVAVLAMTEAIGRLVPGVVGNAESLVEESHEDGLLEYPVYTKPAVWRGREVPPVLLSGDHGKVATWRHEQRLERTAGRRPDLMHAHRDGHSGE